MGKRRYELKLHDRTRVEFSIEDELFGPAVEISDWDEGAWKLMSRGLSGLDRRRNLDMARTTLCPNDSPLRGSALT